jgi:TetR/AcrR family fatty acid metabolism transcriptional regulator
MDMASTSEPVARGRIMAAARKRFEKFGYRATSIALIARDAGIAVGTVYLYFKNKEQILTALFKESNSRWMEEARRSTDHLGNAEERLLRLAQASIERYQRDELLRAVMTRDLEIILAPLCEEFRERVLHHNVELMAEVLRDGMRSGELRPLDPEKTAFVLWTTADALFTQKHHRYEDLIQIYAGIVRDGLRNRDSSGGDDRRTRRRRGHGKEKQ